MAQNHAKYCALGLEADISPPARVAKREPRQSGVRQRAVGGAQFDQFSQRIFATIVDECHRISDDDDSQYQQIIGHLRQVNPQIRPFGLTATPFRLGKG